MVDTATVVVPGRDVRRTRPAARVLINDSWTFAYGEPAGWADPELDDSQWFDVGLPHSFGIPYFLETDFYVGSGVYRRELVLDTDVVPAHVALEFLGVFQRCDVHVNGVRAGGHVGGYTAFVVDIGAHVVPGRNVIAVRVDNEWDARVAPRAGEHVFNGGIYRDVALLTGGPVRIGWYGTTVVARPEGGDGVVEVETEVVNDGPDDAVVRLSSLVGGAGPAADDDVLVPAAGVVTVRQVLGIRDVELWDVISPRLYALEQTLTVGTDVVQSSTTEFGVRTFSFSAQDGFRLNGRRLWLHGANVHQDRAGWGDAATHAGMRRDVTLIREAGMNVIRGSHYPHHPEFVRECDRQGVLFWSELAFWGVGGESAEGFWNASAYPPHPADREAFEESCLVQLREMVRVHRNSPSVVAWSVGNEVFFSDDEVVPLARALTARLVRACHELDPTRPAAVGGAQRRGFDELGDVAGYNGDGAELFHAPPWPSVVTEYGSVVEDRPGRFEPRFRYGTQVEHPWRSGVILWCGFHHGSIVAGMGTMGFVDYHRIPLRSYYWYRKHLRGIAPPAWPVDGVPVAVRLSADATRIGCTGTDDVQLLVELVDAQGRVVADDRPVTVEVLDGGGLLPTGASIVLGPATRSFADGRGAVELRSYHSGQVRVRARADGVLPAELALVAEGGPPWAGHRGRHAPGPPSRRGLRRADGPRELAGARPTACSSAAPQHPSALVTEYADPRGWLPADPAPGAWVEVDLEGLWDLTQVVVRFAAEPDVDVEIRVVGEDAAAVTVAAARSGSGACEVPLDGVRARGVVVRFPGPPAEVVEVHVHGC